MAELQREVIVGKNNIKQLLHSYVYLHTLDACNGDIFPNKYEDKICNGNLEWYIKRFGSWPITIKKSFPKLSPKGSNNTMICTLKIRMILELKCMIHFTKEGEPWLQKI